MASISVTIWPCFSLIHTFAGQPKKRIFSPSDIYTTFKTISDADLHLLLGLSDNRNGWSVLPVPPPPVCSSISGR
ncbi:hypothetical protein C8F01DRAFT_975109 [Mycena amicta]|nr:hypothetical protein C8F01DRAFT_1005374 [Mycena amicta]KAJ7071659.1 hypothetical protein C8F01DRAFT_975109 [Mycena amicta]